MLHTSASRTGLVITQLFPVPAKAVSASSSSSSSTTGIMLSGIHRFCDRKLESNGVRTRRLAPCAMGHGSTGSAKVLFIPVFPPQVSLMLQYRRALGSNRLNIWFTRLYCSMFSISQEPLAITRSLLNMLAGLSTIGVRSADA